MSRLFIAPALFSALLFSAASFLPAATASPTEAGGPCACTTQCCEDECKCAEGCCTDDGCNCADGCCESTEDCATCPHCSA